MSIAFTVAVTLLVLCVIAGFVGALMSRFPRSLGVISGGLLGLFALFPAGCATSSDPDALTQCHTFYGLPLPSEELGIVAAVGLALVLGLVAALLPGGQVE
jgi:hypothetical protein